MRSHEKSRKNENGSFDRWARGMTHLFSSAIVPFHSLKSEETIAGSRPARGQSIFEFVVDVVELSITKTIIQGESDVSYPQ